MIQADIHHAQNSQNIEYSLSSPVTEVDSEETLSAEEGENNAEMDVDRNKRNLQSSSEDEVSQSTLNYLFGSLVNSFSPARRAKEKEKVVHKPVGKKPKVDTEGSLEGFESN